MATVHFIQQGKGGVGKSMIASILYQVLLLLGKKVAAFDTDPVFVDAVCEVIGTKNNRSLFAQ